MIDEAWVISLKRRPERLNEFEQRLHGADPWWHQAQLPKVRVYEAIDGWDELELPDLWTSWGAYGCWRSHLAILIGALARGSNSVMIFEDDAEILPDFPEKLAALMEAAPTWEVLSLGGEHLRRPVPIYGVLRCRMVARTHAYVVRGAALRQLVEVLSRFHGAFPHDWEQSMAMQWYRWYAPRQFFVAQVEGYSDITSKVEPYRRWT